MLVLLYFILSLQSREKLEEFLKNHQSKLDLPNVSGDETIFEYVVADDGHWIHWNTR